MLKLFYIQYDQGPIGVAMVYFVAALSYALTDLPAGAVADKMVGSLLA